MGEPTPEKSGGVIVTFEDVLNEAVSMLKRQGRVSYRALKRQFNLDDNYLTDLKDEMLYTQSDIAKDGERGLVWTGELSEPRDTQPGTDGETRFHAALSAVIIFLQHEERATYRELRHAFGLDDELLEDIQKVLQFKRLAIDEEEKGLVWTGKAQPNILSAPSEPSQQVTSPADSSLSTLVTETETRDNGLTTSPEPSRRAPEAENRQLTVVFCDLADSTRLSQQLDPEDLREVVRAYQEEAAKVVEGYEGHIAQYLGDGLLIYFGWPQAHENDAERAVYTGLELPQAIDKLNHQLQADYGVQLSVRIGIHTGPVVVGEMGGGSRHEKLALGETPNIAARLEGLAKPNTVVISPATAQLVQRTFVLEELGHHELKGVAEPTMLYAVVGTRETEYDDREEMMSGGFDALVGRDEEIGLLLRRWEQSKQGQGQVVLISGEAGLGKSSLVEGLRAQVYQEGYTRIAFRCSPYTVNSAMHPVIEHVQRLLGWQREDSAESRLGKLEQALQSTSLPVEETLPLLAALLSLGVPEDRYPALTLSPQRQRQLTQDTLVAWMLEEADHQPILAVWEDIHWADPSTLELLGLFIEQTPTVSMLNVLAFRPEFAPPWPMQSHMTPLLLSRLERIHIDALVRRLAGGKMLPTEVVEHIVDKTDGVPLYVEELTKMLLESDFLEEHAEQYVLTGVLDSRAIPDSLQASLMARLDRLPKVREVAQLGAVLGREFDYDMLQALTEMDEPTLQAGLSQLVSHELFYQRGRLPRAKFIFRHVLIRDAAYESLLRRTRQQVHAQVSHLLEERFPDIVETQPELVAHHCAEADRVEAAIDYWRQAGQRALQGSAHAEGIAHLRQGLTLLTTLPETPERLQQELDFQVALGPALIATKGHGTQDVERTYARARELCEQVGDTVRLFPVLRGLFVYYMNGGDVQTGTQLGEQLLHIAQSLSTPEHLVVARCSLGQVLFYRGESTPAYTHFTQALESYNPEEHQALVARYGIDLGVISQAWLARELWQLGYPDQAVQQIEDACRLAQKVAHPFSRAQTLIASALMYQFRHEMSPVQERAEAAATLAVEQGFASVLGRATVLKGWALAMQGQDEAGIEELRQGLVADVATGTKAWQPYFLGLLAEAYGECGRLEEGLDSVFEALAIVEHTGVRYYEAELYRIKGIIVLKQRVEDSSEAETCFQQALKVAHFQQAKSWELRAATSLARLWQSQGKRQDAYDLLTPVYDWFTEGFDTADLKEAKVLLTELER